MGGTFPSFVRTPAGAIAFLLAGVALLAGAFLLLESEESEASHWRGGILYWEGGNGTTVKAQMHVYGRLSWGAAMCPMGCAPGVVFDSTTYPHLRTGMPVNANGQGYVDFALRVRSVNPGDDWVIVEIMEKNAQPNWKPGINITYPASDNNGDPWHMTWKPACCRTSNPSSGGGVWWYHQNNANGDMLLWSNVTADGTNSAPVMLVPPIVDCMRAASPDTSLCTFPVPALDPDRDDLEWSWGGNTNARGNPPGFGTPGAPTGGAIWYNPGPPQAPQPAILNKTTGIIDWDTTDAGTGPWPPGSNRFTVYSAHVNVEDNVNGTRSAADFFVRLWPKVPDPPFWQAPTNGANGNMCGATIGAGAGTLVQFDIEAAGVATDPATGALLPITIFDYGLITNMLATYTTGNPATGQISWQTTLNDVGTYVVVFGAKDTRPGFAPLCVVKIYVGHPPIPDFVCASAARPDYRTIEFADASKAGRYNNLVDWEWTFDDGTNASGKSGIKHTFATAGWHNITLKVTNDYNANATITHMCWARPDLPPVMDPQPLRIVRAGQSIVFPLTGNDPDGDHFKFVMGAGPAGASIDAVSDIFYWKTPQISVVTDYEITAWAEETEGDFLTSNVEKFTVRVIPPEPPGTSGPDSDNDGIEDAYDNCPNTFNPSQTDEDSDGLGDACRSRAVGGGHDSQSIEGEPGDQDTSQFRDRDADGVPDHIDNCIGVSNDQTDTDGDGIGDACDADVDGDGTDDAMDNCPGLMNDQTDTDGDGIGDACDQATLGVGDRDNDGITDDLDVCPMVADPFQGDLDGDGEGDACDADIDGDGLPQFDAFGRPADNCPYAPNAIQTDANGDGFGDVCQHDPDGDGFAATDNCPFHRNPTQADADADGVGDACDEDTIAADGAPRVDAVQPVTQSATVPVPGFTWIAGTLVGLGAILAVALLVVMRRK